MLYRVSLDYTANGAGYFAAIADLPWAMWIDSSGIGRYDIMCAQPVTTLVTYGRRTDIAEQGKSRSSYENPFHLVRKQLGERIKVESGIPFAGGAVGYWGYDLARCLGMLPEQAGDIDQVPDMGIGIYDWAIVVDHQQKTVQLVSHRRFPATEQVLRNIYDRLQNHRSDVSATFKVYGSIKSNFSHATYQSAFDTIQNYLNAGDCYQVNLAQRFTADATGSALAAYLTLRELSPAPYSAFLNLPQLQVLCASPERFLQLSNGKVETKPIKGTRPRTEDAKRDAQAIQELLHSGKDRAENLMIVDLLRNDLGTSCIPGSVKVSKLFEVESYAQVHHLVSTVTGELAPGQNAITLLENCFPGGSITGAPKRRAMEIIEELEPNRRGVYCGAIGYIGYDGSMDSNIAIRTLVYSDGKIHCWAGGGIVADSDAQSEFQETQDKAKAMLQMLRIFVDK